MKSTFTQRSRVIDVLRREGKISRNYAIRSMYITRLGAIICDMRQEGWEIATEYTTSPNDCVYRFVRAPWQKESGAQA